MDGLACDEELDLSITLSQASTNFNENDLRCDEVLDSSSYFCSESPVSKKSTEATVYNTFSIESRQYFNHLKSTEQFPEYRLTPVVLQNQSHIAPWMRVVLFDWMMLFWAENHLKRETYNKAVFYVDSYLSRTQNIRSEYFQLVGLVAINIASKLEEIKTIALSELARSAEGTYTCAQIKQMEAEMVKYLRWRTLPVTIFTYLTWMMQQWDMFILGRFAGLPFNRLDLIWELPAEHAEEELGKWNQRFILFKHTNDAAYARYIELMQILDVAYLNLEIYQIDRHIASVGLLYLMIGRYFTMTNYELLKYNGNNDDMIYYNLLSNFGQTPTAMFEQGTEYYANEVACMLHDFISSQLGLYDINAINDAAGWFIQYLDFPSITLTPNYEKEIHYEEYLSFQLHNDETQEYAFAKIPNREEN